MTEEKKEELRQLLEEAMENLRILKLFERDNLSYSKVGYKNLLNQRLTFYGISIDNSHDGIYLQYKPDIENPRTKARLLEFIRKELNQFIEDDEIRYTSYNIDGCATDGFRLSRSSSLGLQPSSSRLQLSDLLEHLLKVALALGVDKAVSTFDEDSRPDGNIRNYQFIASLEGITIETKIQICRGIRLVPVPHDIAFQLNYILRGDCTAIGNSGHPLNQDCDIITITLERRIRWRNENEETSPPSLKRRSFLRHLAVKVRKQNCVGAITSAKTSSPSGSSSSLKMRPLCLPPRISNPTRRRSGSPTSSTSLGG